MERYIGPSSAVTMKEVSTYAYVATIIFAIKAIQSELLTLQIEVFVFKLGTVDAAQRSQSLLSVYRIIMTA